MSFCQSYRFLFLVSLAATAFSQHWFHHCYRQEMVSTTMRQGLEVVQKHAETFADDEVSEGKPASGTTDAGMPGEPHSCPVCSHKQDAEPGSLNGHSHDHAPPAGNMHHHHDHHPAQEPDHHQPPHEHGHGHEHGHEHAAMDPVVSPGLVLMLRQLGFAELAANLLWIQMDADSHRGLWHRVEFALELIPTLDPTFIDAYLLRSFMLDEYQARHEEALKILETAVQQNPHRIELWQQIGLVCLNHTGRHGPKRNLPRALEAFSRANSVAEPPPFLIRLLAVTLAAMERRDEAVKILQDVTSTPGRSATQRQQDAEMIHRIRGGDTF